MARPPSAREIRLARQVEEADALIAAIQGACAGNPETDRTLTEARRGVVQALDDLAAEQAARDALSEAQASLERALRLSDSDEVSGRLSARLAAVLNNLSLVHSERLDLPEAERLLRKAISLQPDYAQAHFNLSRVLLMQGNYAEGWRENEWRWDCPEFPSTWRDFPYAWWNGASLAGKRVLVWSEQGIGDEIMFAGTIPDAIAEAAHVVLECNARLVPIFRRSFTSATVVARRDPPDPAIAAANIDVQLPLASLCLRYRASKEAFANNRGRYLLADPERTTALRQRYRAWGEGLLVGICWRSGNPKMGHERSAPLSYWDRLLTRRGCQFVSLQYGEVGGEIAAVQDRLGLTIRQDREVDPLTNVEDWFAQVAVMDHVISIDNSTIQVSGAQGIPTWTLLSYAPEWRFGLSGSTHDWHPSVRVFRQPAPGDWSSVFAEVEVALDQRPGGSKT